MKAIKLRDLKPNEMFTRKPIEEPNEKQVFYKRDYIKSDKRFICEHYNDMNSYITLKPDTTVYIDFYF